MDKFAFRGLRKIGLAVGALACAALALPAAGQAAANVQALPNSLLFAPVMVGEAGPTQSVTFTNLGSDPAPIEGTFFSDEGTREFEIETSTCSAELQPAESCEMSVYSAPQRQGPHTAFLVLALQDGSEIPVSLSGTGLVKAVELPASVDFGAVTQNATAEQLVTVENNGNVMVSISKFEIGGTDAADFSVKGNNCNGLVMPATSCTLNVQFKPGATGVESAELKAITDGIPAEPVAALHGEGVAAQLTFDPGVADFGLVEVHGEGSEQTLTLTNEGAASVHIEWLGIVGLGSNEYWIGNSNCYGATLLPAQSCSLVVHFNPQNQGTLEAQVRAQVDGGTAFEGTLTGRAARPIVTATPNPVDFGEAGVGTGGSLRTMTLTNSGEIPVAFFLGFVSGGDVSSFRMVEESCTGRMIAPGDSCTTLIRFTPTAGGTRQATVSFFGNGEGALQVPLTGVGLAANASLTPGVVDFGSQPLGTAGPSQSFTLTDESTAGLEIGTVGVTGPDADQFRIAADPCTETALAPGSSCSIGVRFAPDGGGAKSATLRVRTSAGVRTAALGGEGIAAPAPEATTPTAARCVVPRLRGRKLSTSRRVLAASGCRAGRVQARKAASAKPGKVIGQDRKPGAVLPPGAAVDITLARR